MVVNNVNIFGISMRKYEVKRRTPFEKKGTDFAINQEVGRILFIVNLTK